jgi:hypothetical protein
MTSMAPIFFSERLREYQKSIAKSDPEFDQKLKEKELDDKYKDQMMEGCRIFVNQIQNINDKKFSLGYNHDLAFQIPTDKETKSKYFYTGCPELKKFIDEFNSKDKNNQILFYKDKFVNKISIYENDIKNGKLNYELSYDLDYNDVYKSGYLRPRYVKIPDPPSKDNVFFG